MTAPRQNRTACDSQRRDPGGPRAAAGRAGRLRAHARGAAIAPYTDLRLHDLGMEMADENAAGARVPGKWRTAPLWGLGYRMTTETHPTFLHDGRARARGAILWHSGEAAQARRNFMNLWGRPREALLRWLGTL